MTAWRSWRTGATMNRLTVFCILVGFAIGARVPALAQHGQALGEPIPVESTVVRLAPVADGNIVDQSPFDGIPDGVLRTHSNVVFLDQGITDMRSVIEFDLVPLADANVTNASLELVLWGKAIPPELSLAPIEIRAFPADGFVRHRDFHRGQFVDVFDALPASFDVPVLIDVTKEVQRGISSSSKILGFILRTNSGAQIDFGSLELGTPPALVVTHE